MIKKFWLWLGIGLIWLLVGCRHSSPAETALLPTLTPTATLDLPTAPPQTLFATTPLPTTTYSPTPTLLPTATPLPLLSQPCGIILPILPANIPPETTQLPLNPSLTAIPEEAHEAVRYLLKYPDRVALVAFRVGEESNGIYHNPDVPMPLASVVKLIHLLAYAEAVNARQLDPAEWILLSELERYYLPGTDLKAQEYALEDLEEAGLVAGTPPQLPLEEIPEMMINHSSNAATDYLHQRLGQMTIETTVQKWGLTGHTAPCPFIGQFLIMANHIRTVSDRTAIESYLNNPESYQQDVARLTDAFATYSWFREQELEWRSQNRRPSIETQHFFSHNLNSFGTARGYANLMATIATNQLDTSFMNIVVRRYLEWPMTFTVNQELFWTMGYKGGSLPGILTGVYYAEPLNYRVPVVVAIFYRGLPMETYREWRESWPHDELARWLMYDATAITTLRQILQSE